MAYPVLAADCKNFRPFYLSAVSVTASAPFTGIDIIMQLTLYHISASLLIPFLKKRQTA
jgi:hypothetical protein